MQIYPAILTDQKTVFEHQLELVRSNGEYPVLHVDVIDGFFADNITVAPLDLVGQDFGKLTMDLHIMADEPMDFVYEASAIKDVLPIRTIIAQVEHMSSQAAFLEEVKVQGWQTGLALDVHTPLDALDPESWQHLNVIQLMAVTAGQQGQLFQPLVLEKLRSLVNRVTEEKIPLEIIVDGGIHDKLLDQLTEAGADSVAMGSAIWAAADPAQALLDLASG